MKLAIFDLDYTIWQPEMYQIHGPPKLTPITQQKYSTKILKQARTIQKDMILTDRRNTPMRVFEGASFALQEIRQLQDAGHDIQCAISSRTDEPSWARICLQHLVIDDEGTTLDHVFDKNLREISYTSKAKHIQRLHSKTGIALQDMVFFDNEHWNIQDVTQTLPAVKCFYCPDGMTRLAWQQAKAEFGLS